MKFKYTIDSDVAKIYAESKCNTCWGKGVIEIETGLGKKDIKHINKSYCTCVRKNMKKYNHR